MKKTLITLALLLAFTAPASAQEQLLPEPEQPGYQCEDANEPLRRNSTEARRMLNSENPDVRGCAELRIALYEQIENGIKPTEEVKLDSSLMSLQLTLIQLLQQLQQLLLQQQQ